MLVMCPLDQFLEDIVKDKRRCLLQDLENLDDSKDAGRELKDLGGRTLFCVGAAIGSVVEFRK